MMRISPETQAFICEHPSDDVRTLALQSRKYPHVDMPTAITQIAGRQVATEKIPSWKEIEDIWYPKHLSLEQCSSEITARYKARLLARLPQKDSFADLTGGFGIDCSFLAAGFNSATYVERQKELCEIAAHNFPILGLNHLNVRNEDGVTYLEAMSPVDCIFLDPARRNEHGGKTVAISDCEPNVAELEELLLSKADCVMVKLSPMLDLSLALKELHHAREVHIISVNNECKELLVLLGQSSAEKAAEIPIHCINLSTKGEQGEQHFTFSREQEQRSQCTYTNALSTYLYEPNASLLKAGAFRSISAAYSLRKLHPNSHLYTSETLIEHFPGRAFRITNQYSFNKKEIKEGLSDLKKANITVRNFPATVAELRKRTKLAEGGDTYLFASTLNEGQKVLIRCEKA
ncbi:class I SAM-dependent methyltransferase [uncultured Bacteroides sp.]|uniref:class I SAM-dependent methyltransferase n=1 Tax=uncultured Bacteroides sp. TaxID=162156 RepID=UPI0025DC3C02|nr:class I SAM-dependent methyltransferase [uncultured Bacteroides sp.]